MGNGDGDLIDEQIIVVVLYIISLLISLNVLLNRRNNIENPTDRDIRLFNRFFVVIIYIIFIFISFKAFQRSQNKLDYMILVASAIAVVPPIIFLYALILELDENITTAESPLL